MKGRRCTWEWNEPIKHFQTSFEDWKPLIDGGNVVFRVCKYGNVDEKVRKKKKIWIENDLNVKIRDENTIQWCSVIKTYLESCIFCMASCIQHKEWTEEGRNSRRMMFNKWRMINHCFLSFWLANARSIQQNIQNPNFFVSKLKSAPLDSWSLKWQSWPRNFSP